MDPPPQHPPSSQSTPAPNTATTDAERIIAAIMSGGTTLAQLGAVLNDAAALEATTRSTAASPILTRGGDNLTAIGHALSRAGSAPPHISVDAPDPVHLTAPAAVVHGANIATQLGNLVRDASDLAGPSRSGAVSPALARGGETLTIIGNALASSSTSQQQQHHHAIPPSPDRNIASPVDPHAADGVARGGELVSELGALVRETGEIDAPTGSGALSPSLVHGGDTLSKLGAALVGPPPAPHDRASPASPHSASVLTRGGETLARIGAVFGEEGHAQGGETLAKLGGILAGVGNLQSEIRPMLSPHPTDRDVPSGSHRRVSVAPTLPSVLTRDLPPLPSSRAPSTSRQHTLRRSYSPHDEYLAGAESLGRDPTLTFARRPMSDSAQYAGIGAGGGSRPSPKPDVPPGLTNARGHTSWSGVGSGPWANAPPQTNRGMRPISGASQDRGEGGSGHGGHGNGTDLSYIVPEEKRARREVTVGERLQPTIEDATVARDKADARAKWTGLTLNIVIGLQVLLGALTTGLGAALHNASITISILGGASTLAASYLARARGSGEPEVSALRVQALEHFLREAKAFQLDRGHAVGNEYDAELEGFRRGLEGLLSNAGEGMGGMGAGASSTPMMKQAPYVGYGEAGTGMGMGMGMGMPGMPGGMHAVNPHVLPVNAVPGATTMGTHLHTLPHTMPLPTGGAMPVGVGAHPGMGMQMQMPTHRV